eukprot:gene30246-35230_t
MASEIIDIVLDPTDLNAIDLSSVNSVCRWSSNFRFFDLSAGEEHYRLLAHVARSVRRPTIIDIGHFQSLSAAALSLATEKTVRSFDLISSLPSAQSVPTAIHIPNVRLEIGPNYMRDLPNHLQTSDLFILDIDHLGKSERDIFKVLEESKFDGLLIVDDIHLNEHMQRFWDDIKQTKYNISSSVSLLAVWNYESRIKKMRATAFDTRRLMSVSTCPDYWTLEEDGSGERSVVAQYTADGTRKFKTCPSWVAEEESRF